MSILNTPITVNGLQLKNRLVMPPMATAKSDPDGRAAQQLLDYYDKKSKGGHIGLIIIEHCYVNPAGKASAGQLSASRREDLPGLRRLAEVIHGNGSKVILQISHAGSAASEKLTGLPVLGPSAVRNPRVSSCVPAAMTKDDPARVTDDFAAAALLARDAGFDGVEIHSAHGYLLNQFYSPLTNRRTDEYGPASVESRLRLHLEIIAAVRAAVGPEYPLALRLGACDYADGGSTLQDGAAAAGILEGAGIDLLDISGGCCGYLRPDAAGPGYFSDAAEAVRQAVRIPVILTGGITKAEEAEALLAGGKADLIGVGRAILKDSAWAAHAVSSLS